jgi:hypothetical protein
MNELISNPKRQANYTIDAYFHQIWHSLLRWIDLGEDEALFLEGAEDIDFYRSDDVTAIQIKKTPKPLTLSSKDALESIANFWNHKRQNPGVTIKFQFVTTAERGMERSKPFGEVKGLDLWDSCKHQGSNPKTLKGFLSKQPRLPKNLRDFIKIATDEQLRLELLIPFEWNTGGNSQSFVEDVVRRKVSGYGDRLNSPHSESVNAIPLLLQHVFDTARQKDSRWLYASDFRQLFQEAITERVPRPELQRLRQAEASYAQLMAQPGMIGIADDSRVVRPVEIILEVLRPPHNERLVRRKQLVTDLLDRLNNLGMLVMRGSTGMGKSTLATAVAVSGPGNWRQLDMRGVKPEQVKDRLLHAAYLIEGSREQIDCIVDDLNFDRRPDVYENALSRLIYAVKLNSGRFIVTTQGILPSRIVALYGISPNSFIDVPLLSEQEVTELVSNHGCPAGSFLHGWGQIISISTKGHPQLAHASVINQKGKGWRAPIPDDLVSSPGIEEIRREIRQRLREQISSDDARTLLYRLSVFTGRFERQQALHLGRLEPQIRIPGDVFDSLVGPWIEQADEKHFRMSPLLGNTAGGNFSQQELVELHCAASHSFLALPSIDLLGLSSLLTHAFAGRDKEALVTVVLSIFSKEGGISWSALSTFIGWFGFVKFELGEKLFDGDPFLNDLLRRLQFKITTEINPDLAVKVAKVWEQEVRQLADAQLPAEISRMSLLVFLNEVTSAERVPFPIFTALSHLCENYRVLKNIKAFLPKTADERDSLVTEYQLTVNPQFFLFMAKRRCKGAADIVELLAAMDEVSGEEIEEFWQLLSSNDNEATLLIDKGWLTESSAEPPDWQTYLESLDRALAIASKRKAISLIAAIYHAKAVVLKEYCDDRQSALEALADGETAIGHQHVVLQEYRAKIFFLEENYEEALAIWRSIFLVLKNDQDEGLLYAYRNAAICAAELGYWAEAADLFRRGAEVAKLPSIKTPDTVKYQQDHSIEYSFRAEQAWVLWKAGECALAVNEFATIVDTFAKPPGREGNLHSHFLYRRIRHAINWMELQMSGSQRLFEPKPGWFTQWDHEDKIIKELQQSPPPPLTQLWFILARLEYKLMPTDSIFKRLESKLLASPLPIVMLGYYDLRLRHSLRQLRAEGLIADFLNLSAEFKARAEQQQEKPFDVSGAAVLKRILFAVLIKFLSEGQRRTVPIPQWKQDVDKSTQLKEAVGEWLDYVQERLDDDPNNLKAILTDHAIDVDRKLVAALLLAAAGDLDPETIFCAHVLLVQSDYSSQWQDVYADSLVSMISREWEKIAEHQPHAILAPRLNCPAILSTCRDTSRNGLRKAAAILLSAKNAVQTILPETILDKLLRLNPGE